MREILFRGKSVSSGEWVYGLYVDSIIPLDLGRTHKSWIVGTFVVGKNGYVVPKRHTAVANDTVSQYTGINDKYGHKIFEGDFLKVVRKGIERFAHVIYIGTAFYVPEFGADLDSVIFDHAVEIIGNIYDNPNFIKTIEERK